MALAALLLGGAAARADLASWKYNWTPNVPAIFSDQGNSKITLTNEPSGNAVGTSDIVATNLKTFSTADPNNPDTFSHKGYGLVLALTDVASGTTGTLTFSGEFNGTLSSLSSIITNSFTNSVTQQLTLGNNQYTVTIGPFTPPAPPGASNFGSISATAFVTVGNINHSPEPATFILAGLGLGVLGLVSLYRWKRGQAPAAVAV
jgi:hypothetical protein